MHAQEGPQTVASDGAPLQVQAPIPQPKVASSQALGWLQLSSQGPSAHWSAAPLQLLTPVHCSEQRRLGGQTRSAFEQAPFPEQTARQSNESGHSTTVA